MDSRKIDDVTELVNAKLRSLWHDTGTVQDIQWCPQLTVGQVRLVIEELEEGNDA